MPVKLRGNFLGGTPAHWDEDEFQEAEQSFWSAIRSGKIAFDGDFGGPGWSEGKYQDSVRSYWTARSAQDQRSKEHDAVYADVGPNGEFTDPSLIDADWSYAKNSIGTGFKNSLAGLAVGAQGAARSAVKAASGATGKKRFRDEDAAPVVPLPDSWQNNKDSRRKFAGPTSDAKHNFDIHKHDMDVEDAPTDTVEEIAGGAAAGSAGVASGKGRETAIMRPPKRIRWNIPDYHHAKVVYSFYTAFAQLEVSTFASDATDLLLNMNGCHDIIETNALYTGIRDNNTVSTGVNSSASNQPSGWLYWKALYEKYTVLNCEYDITMQLKTPTETTQESDDWRDNWFFAHEVGTQSNPYDSSALQIMNDLSIKHHAILGPKESTTLWTVNETPTPDLVVPQQFQQITFSGHANQATFDKFAKEITDDDANTIWTDVGQNPALIHRLRLGVRPISKTFSTGDLLNYRGRIIYTVQFRQKVDTMHGYKMELRPQA